MNLNSNLFGDYYFFLTSRAVFAIFFLLNLLLDFKLLNLKIMKRRIICFVFMMFSTMWLSSCWGQHFITARVTGKERIQSYYRDEDGDKIKGASYYLVYTDKEVLKIEDSLIFGQFNSSDIYGLLAEGRTYKFKVFGFRIPFLSSYRNIIGVYSTNNKPIDVPKVDNKKDVFVVKVLGKERVDGVYLIYTNEGTFKIEDSLIFGRFNSSDVYGMMRKGKYYRIKTFGIRSGFLSSYKNIIEVEALE